MLDPLMESDDLMLMQSNPSILQSTAKDNYEKERAINLRKERHSRTNSATGV